MPVASTAGYPAYSGSFISEIWSGNLNVKFYDTSVAPFITNSKYEG